MPVKGTTKLNPAFIAKIKEISDVRKFSLACPLFYEGQIPIVAYLVLEGSIVLSKKKKVKNIIKPGHLVGLNHLMAHTPSKMDAEVAAESTLCFLDKSTAFEIINLDNSELSKLLSKIANIKPHGNNT
jgi:CRP-like cAMP-binding protein